MSSFINSFFAKETPVKRKRSAQKPVEKKVNKSDSKKSYNGYVFKELKKSKVDNRRYDAVFVNVNNDKEKRVSFGKQGEKDFIALQDKKMREFYDYKNKGVNLKDLMSRQALEKYILWNKPTLESSINDYKKRLKDSSK